MHAEAVCFLTARAALFFTPHASLMQDVPCLPLSGSFGELCCQTVPTGCWTERMSHRYTRFLVPLPLPDLACRLPLYDRYSFGLGAFADRYTRAMHDDAPKCSHDPPKRRMHRACKAHVLCSNASPKSLIDNTLAGHNLRLDLHVGRTLASNAAIW